MARGGHGIPLVHSYSVQMRKLRPIKGKWLALSVLRWHERCPWSTGGWVFFSLQHWGLLPVSWTWSQTSASLEGQWPTATLYGLQITTVLFSYMMLSQVGRWDLFSSNRHDSPFQIKNESKSETLCTAIQCQYSHRICSVLNEPWET